MKSKLVVKKNNLFKLKKKQDIYLQDNFNIYLIWNYFNNLLQVTCEITSFCILFQGYCIG